MEYNKLKLLFTWIWIGWIGFVAYSVSKGLTSESILIWSVGMAILSMMHMHSRVNLLFTWIWIGGLGFVAYLVSQGLVSELSFIWMVAMAILIMMYMHSRG